jgi:hypothetical protein
MKNRKTYFTHFLLLIMLAVVSACEKDKPIPFASNGCEDFPELWNTWFAEHRFQYKASCFNPTNSNEFIYYYKDNESNVFQLVKFNLQTKQKTVLVNSFKIHGQPDWSSNGWIAFTRVHGYVDHIFIVKDNGDSLTQITSATANLNPFWNDEANELYWTHSPDLGSQWYLLKKINNILVTDTVSDIGGFHNVDVLNGKLLNIRNLESGGFNGNPTYYGYHILNSPPFTQHNFIVIGNSFGATSGITWHPSGSFFYVSHSGGNGRGLHKISLNGVSKPLIKHCDNKRYSIISCSPDGKNLIAERVDSFLEYNNENEPTGKIIEKSSIWLIDTETLKETKINLE